MAKQPSKPQAPPLASWDVSKIASKAVLLGTVEAADAIQREKPLPRNSRSMRDA